MEKAIILEEKDVSERILTMAEEITKRNKSTDNLVLVGIRTGGAFLAERLQDAIFRLTDAKASCGILDITLYRDDWTRIGTKPEVKKTEIPFSIDDRIVVLVDDVLFTGRTVRAAMDALMDYGRPRKIELAVLVDRGETFRELPIMPNYSGGIWDTKPEETINVYLREEGYPDHVAIETKKTA